MGGGRLPGGGMPIIIGGGASARGGIIPGAPGAARPAICAWNAAATWHAQGEVGSVLGIMALFSQCQTLVFASALACAPSLADDAFLFCSLELDGLSERMTSIYPAARAQ
jgi:hypothetical protein